MFNVYLCKMATLMDFSYLTPKWMELSPCIMCPTWSPLICLIIVGIPLTFHREVWSLTESSPLWRVIRSKVTISPTEITFGISIWIRNWQQKKEMIAMTIGQYKVDLSHTQIVEHFPIKCFYMNLQSYFEHIYDSVDWLHIFNLPLVVFKYW